MYFFLFQIYSPNNTHLLLVTLHDGATDARIRIKFWGEQQRPLVVGQQLFIKNLSIQSYEGVNNANTTPSIEVHSLDDTGQPKEAVVVASQE